MNFVTLQKDNRQRGMALILAIGFLLVLSILGAVVLDVSTRDLKASSETRPMQEAFYTADRTVEYAMNRDIIMTLGVDGVVNLANETAGTSDIVMRANNTAVPGGETHKMVIELTGAGRLLNGTVRDLGPRSLPPAMAAIHGSEFGANLYHVNVETEATLSKRSTHVDASIVRLFKMDDDQIFRTSGGG